MRRDSYRLGGVGLEEGPDLGRDVVTTKWRVLDASLQDNSIVDGSY